MPATLVDVLVTLFAAAGVLGLAGTGVWALPWRDQQVEASWSAWRLVGAMPAVAIGAGWRATAPTGPLLADLSPDSLLPAPLPRPARERSRARRLGHVALYDAPRCLPRSGGSEADARVLRCEATPAPTA